MVNGVVITKILYSNILNGVILQFLLTLVPLSGSHLIVEKHYPFKHSLHT